MPYKDPVQAKARRKAYYDAHREEAIAKSAEWRIANPERYREHMHASYGRHKDDPAFLEKRRLWTLAWRDANPDKVAEYRNREDIRKANRAKALQFQKAHPEQGRASKQVSQAIKRGVLVRPDTCERCSGPGPIEAAHEDYAKPLEVQWLCRSCHRSWDKRQPKLSRP